MSVQRIALVIGVGPGLGLSIAHRFGREGYTTALVSRDDARHAGYVKSLAEGGIEAAAFTADVRDTARLLAVLDTVEERYGRIDLVYYGPGAADPQAMPAPIDQTRSDDV